MPLPGPLPPSLQASVLGPPHLTHPPLPVPFNLPFAVAPQKLDANRPLFFLISSTSFSSLSSSLPLSLSVYFLVLSLSGKNQSEHKAFASTTQNSPKSPSPSTFPMNIFKKVLFIYFYGGREGEREGAKH